MTTPPQTSRVPVAIVGAGPAGLMLSHLLSRVGIESVNIDIRSRKEIEETHRAGILEQGSVDMLLDTGVSDRILRDGHRHDGIELAFGGGSHRIDFQKLVGASAYLYPQTDVFIDLADARERDGGDVRFSVTDVSVDDLLGSPVMRFTDADGVSHEIRADYLVGADGSRSVCRAAVPEAERTQYFNEYPFAWFGILAEAPPSAPELIYSRTDDGFALVSQRTETIQRMYFQCDPSANVDDYSDDRIWDEMAKRVEPNGFTLKTGPIVQKTVLPFRSFVQTPMRYGNMLLAGDAAHTVPPTGAKGLNLALADVKVLAEELEIAIKGKDVSALTRYTERALDRVWKAQHFSYWMTQMLHNHKDSSEFHNRRQLGELAMVTGSEHGQRYLAEAYTGWPISRKDA